jgi:hypothetical protein
MKGRLRRVSERSPEQSFFSGRITRKLLPERALYVSE